MSGLSHNKWSRDLGLHLLSVTSDIGATRIPGDAAKGEDDTLLFEAKAFKELFERLSGVDVCLREQDLTFFAVEGWRSNPTVTYIPWEGELPFLYQISKDNSGLKADELVVERDMDQQREAIPDEDAERLRKRSVDRTHNNSVTLLYLAEVLHRATGSGLGFTGHSKTLDTLKSGLWFDLGLARRFRYNTYKIDKVTWIERAESGRRTSVAGVKIGGSHLLRIG